MGAIEIVGKLDDRLPALLNSSGVLVARSGEASNADGLILLGSTGIGGLSSGEMARVAAAFHNGKVIAIAMPSSPEVTLELAAFLAPEDPSPGGQGQNISLFAAQKLNTGNARYRSFVSGSASETAQDQEPLDVVSSILHISESESNRLPSTILAAVGLTDPEKLYSQLENNVDFVSGPYVWDWLTTTKPYPAPPITLTITTNAVMLSQQELESPDVNDYYFLVHNFVINPVASHIDVYEYKITVTQVEDKGNPRVQRPDHSTPIVSSPPTTEGVTVVSSSIGWSLGGNVGSFGEVVTGGLSGSVSISKSTSYSIPDVSVQNRTDGTSSIFLFELSKNALVRKATFQPTLSHIFRVKDDKKWPKHRSALARDYQTAFHAKFSIVLEAFGFDNQNLPGSVVLRVERTISIRVPPLPSA